uniref:B9 domain-containing protein 1 n=1 Tax=Onchocerca volvulus TaxID=6282 RepID=A0A8R1TQU1_ONCVO
MSVKQSKLSNFIVLLNGQIDSAKFFSFDNFYCKYSYVYGIDWKQVGGIHEGLSARCERSGNTGITVGMPIEATFISTNPFGYFFGNDVICGYGAVHIPTVPGRTIRKITMFVPEASTLLQRFIGWLTGKRAEFVDPKIVATADGRQVTKVRSQGIIIITMDIVLKDMKKYGYDVVPSSLYNISERPLPDFTKIFDEQIQIRQGERLTHPIPESKVEMYEYELEPGPSNTSQLMKSHAASTRPIPIPRQIIEKSMDIAEEISEGTIT